MSLRTYDPKLVLCSLGAIGITGFADGTFVEVSRDEDAFTKLVGAGGDVVRARNRNKSGSATFTLLASAPENDLLSALALEDELAGTGTRAFLVKEANGTTILAGQGAWVKKVATAGFGKEAGTREWIVDIAELDMTVGGLAT